MSKQYVVVMIVAALVLTGLGIYKVECNRRLEAEIYTAELMSVKLGEHPSYWLAFTAVNGDQPEAVRNLAEERMVELNGYKPNEIPPNASIKVPIIEPR